MYANAVKSLIFSNFLSWLDAYVDNHNIIIIGA